MFRAPLHPSSGAWEYYTGGCRLWYVVLWFSSSSLAAARTPDTSPSAQHHTDNLKTKAPNTTGSNHLYNTLELLMMGIMVPEICWASNKTCYKHHLLHLVGILFPQINDDARSKSHYSHWVIWILHWLYPSGRNMALWSNQPLREMNTRDTS